jgi:hypothetical protein
MFRYRCTENIHLPFRVISSVKEIGRTRIEAEVTVKSTFSPALYGSMVKIKIPTPKNTGTNKRFLFLHFYIHLFTPYSLIYTITITITIIHTHTHTHTHNHSFTHYSHRPNN